MGDLKAAENLINRIYTRVNDAGWRTWLPTQLSLSKIDLLLVRKGYLNTRERNKLRKIKERNFDENQTAVSIDLELISAWAGKELTDWTNIEMEYLQHIQDYGDDPETVCPTRLGYAELLKKVGRLDEAEEQAKFVIHYSTTKSRKLWLLHAKTVQADILRLKGRTPNWRKLARDYKKVGCRIGELYVTTIGICAGAKLDENMFDSLYKYATYNGLQRLTKLLRKNLLPLQDETLELLFPGMVTA